MSAHTYRLWQMFMVLVSMLVLLVSFYLQLVKGLQPCPLCIMQRICVFLAFAACLLAYFAGPWRWARTLLITQFVIAVAGLYFAVRHLWLQSLPSDQAPACLPSLKVLVKYFPWQDIANALFWGAADCAEVSWQWLGLSLPGWSALYFCFLMLAVIPSWLFLKKSRS